MEENRGPFGKITFFSRLTVCAIGAIAAAYLLFRYLLPAVLPFLIAWGLAFAARPLARKVAGKGAVKSEKFFRVLFALSFLLIGFGGAALLVGKLAAEAVSFLSGLAESGRLDEITGALFRPFGDSDAAAGAGGKIGEALSSVVGALLGQVGGAVAAFAAKVPEWVFFSIMLLIATVYFAIDLERVNAAVVGLLPERAQKYLRGYKESTVRVVLRYLRSYALLMLITFAVVLTGFLLLRVHYALLLAAVVALLDALPVLGVGTVLVPFSVSAFLTDKTGLGVGLLVLLAVNEILRQFLEPKILGKNLGIHPILTLFLLYAGYFFLGIAGLLFVPIFAVIIDPVIRRFSERKNSADEQPEKR